MTLPLGAVDPNNPIQVAQWMQHMQDDLRHVHECIERRDAEARARDQELDELSESRHQQNINALKEIGDKMQLFSVFVENAGKEELSQAAVAVYRAKVKTKAQERRAAVRHVLAELSKYASPAVVVAVGAAVARHFGL